MTLVHGNVTGLRQGSFNSGGYQVQAWRLAFVG